MWISRAAAISSTKRPRYEVKNLDISVELLETVRESTLSRQSDVSFPDLVDIDNEVPVPGVLSDNKLINAALGNGEDDDDDESNVE